MADLLNNNIGSINRRNAGRHGEPSVSTSERENQRANSIQSNDMITLLAFSSTSLSALIYYIYHQQSQRYHSIQYAQCIDNIHDLQALLKNPYNHTSTNSNSRRHPNAIYAAITGTAHTQTHTNKLLKSSSTSSTPATNSSLKSIYTPTPLNLLWHQIVRTTTYIKLFPLLRLPWFEYDNKYLTPPNAVDFTLYCNTSSHHHNNSISTKSSSSASSSSSSSHHPHPRPHPALIHVSKDALLHADKVHLYGNYDYQASSSSSSTASNTVPSTATPITSRTNKKSLTSSSSSSISTPIQEVANVIKPIEQSYIETLRDLNAGRLPKHHQYKEYGIVDGSKLTTIGYISIADETHTNGSHTLTLLAPGEYGDHTYDHPTIITSKSYHRVLNEEYTLTRRLKNTLLSTVSIAAITWSVIIGRAVYQLYVKNAELARLIELQQLRRDAAERRKLERIRFKQQIRDKQIRNRYNNTHTSRAASSLRNNINDEENQSSLENINDDIECKQNNPSTDSTDDQLTTSTSTIRSNLDDEHDTDAEADGETHTDDDEDRSVSSSASTPSGNLCAICAEGEANCVLLNCFHQATCVSCSEQLIARNFR